MAVQVVVLAGGLGTRMAEFTGNIPKALIPVHGKPFAHYQVEWLARCGVERITFSVGYLGEQIEDSLRALPDPGVQLDFVFEGNDLRGTGGALRHAADQGALESEFLLLYGDSYLPIDVMEVWRAYKTCGRPALMTVFKNHGQFDRSNAHFENGNVPFYSKRRTWREPLTWIDYGLSALSRGLILGAFRSGEKADLASLFEALSENGQLAGYQVFDRFYEIGSPQGLAEFRDFIAPHLTRS
ncbi:MAG: NTP transferase domain-containing protein [Bdellovibrionales bacterium]